MIINSVLYTDHPNLEKKKKKIIKKGLNIFDQVAKVKFVVKITKSYNHIM